MTDTLYMDHQATTPAEKSVLSAMSDYWEKSFGNPHSNGHAVGWKANAAISKAASNVATLIGAEKDEVIFTSGATESNNIAAFSLCELADRFLDRKQVLVSPIEHKCVLNSIDFWAEKNGLNVAVLKVDSAGYIDIDFLNTALKTPTLFCSIGYVNNEIGTIQDIKRISNILRDSEVIFHSDCAQAPKTLDCTNIAELTDLASFSGHKIGGPVGIGALYISGHLHEQIQPLIQGGGQQNGLRSGTLPLPLCVGFGEACRLLSQSESKNLIESTRVLRDYFFKRMTDLELPIRLNGPKLSERHAGNLNIAFEGIKAMDLLMALQPNLCASSGSACGSGNIEPSHVLKALGLSDEKADSSIRLSLSHMNTKDEIDKAVKLISARLDNL